MQKETNETSTKEKDPETTKTFRHKTLEERAADFGGKLDLDGEFDWGDPVGRMRHLRQYATISTWNPRQGR